MVGHWRDDVAALEVSAGYVLPGNYRKIGRVMGARSRGQGRVRMWGSVQGVRWKVKKQWNVEPKRRDHGLHTIIPAPKEVSGRIDIIAIHGLNGHYLDTWADPATGVNWLRDLIPKVVPAARVLSFSYNSMLQFSKSTADVSTFSLQLLEGIVAERRSLEENDRPVLFICHSLGGLVFKQAYLLACENTNYTELKRRVGGVLFFGTPHRGSSMAWWAKTAARLLELASLGTSTNTQLAKDLDPSSQRLRFVSDAFYGLCSRDELPVVSCYETDKIGGLNTVIVDRDSVVLGVAGEITIAVEGDHRSMCRFSNLEEKRFLPVAMRLQKMASASLSQSTSRVQSLMESFSKANYAAHKARNPAAVEGTCRWILRHPTYQDWMQSPDAAFLWISGDPGSGKSVLASFLVDTLSKTSRASDLNVCYFFFKSDNLEQSSAVNALQALLHQVLVQQTGVATTAVSLLPGHAIEDVGRLWAALVSLARLGVKRTTVCILDAIDECAAKSRKDLLNCISSFISPRKATQNSSETSTGTDNTLEVDTPVSRLKIIVTSRPDNQIKVAFEKALARSQDPQRVSSARVATTMIRLRAEDEIDNIGADVTSVIRFKIQDLVESGLPRELLEKVQLELIARADRTFLWVSLVLSLLEEKVEAGASKRELDAVLKTRDIFAIYSQLLESKPNTERAKKLLYIVLAAARPLTLEEISVALAIMPENDILRQWHAKEPLKPGMLTLDDVEDDIFQPFENHVKSLCGHFVRIVRNKVYLVHETAREYLLEASADAQYSTRATADSLRGLAPTTTNQGSFQHSFTLVAARALLLEICVTYLYCLAKGARDSDTAGYTTPLTKPFLSYAAKSWFVHFHQVSHLLRDGVDNIRYFQNLCHPLFPGFRLWTAEYWRPNPPRHPVVSHGAVDEVQDYYSLQQDTKHEYDGRGREDVVDSDISSPDEEEEEEDEKDGEDGQDSESMQLRHAVAMPRQIPLPKQPTLLFSAQVDQFDHHQPPFSALFTSDVRTLTSSANPTSLRNYNFPLRVNPLGVVTLDYLNEHELKIRGAG
ncbi:hypothetical protein B0T16DRAFT_438603 [Cercophora newfieldiana]|uniref:NACHT domain-containing protein n=1 Tax=Cercophora newfieldiana TaxID=92897 RepID=A0AA39XWB3_9PEZI|nr:hypothetical protein B0T16DRAFT_438603 [Cercophora newfieldiana]